MYLSWEHEKNYSKLPAGDSVVVGLYNGVCVERIPQDLKNFVMKTFFATSILMF